MPPSPCGFWKSPITANVVSSTSTQLTEVEIDDNTVYWRESRPEEGGRYTIIQLTPDGNRTEITPKPWNARTRTHEYGGGNYLAHKGTIFFSNFADQQIYRKEPQSSEPHPVTRLNGMRYADGIFDKNRNRIVCVREDHTHNENSPTNTLTVVELGEEEQGERVLVSGNDFYSSPRISPNGDRIAWLTWNHPNMPWNGTELWVGEFDAEGSLSNPMRIAGGSSESITQPTWSPDGILHFISDRSEWWNLYRYQDGKVESLCQLTAEFARPSWVFGMSSYAFESSSRIFCTYALKGTWHLAELSSGKLDTINTPYTEFDYVKAVRGRVLFIAGSPTECNTIVEFNPETRTFKNIRQGSTPKIDPGYLSVPEPIEFPTTHGLTSHAFFYPPRNPDFSIPQGELPPLIVISHGGPTSATRTNLNLTIQFWTSRGLAVLDVNYGGSTGYGRAYRERLYGQWGVVDVDDCVNGALFLAGQARVDRGRLAIRGGSAGGYTTLCALTFRNVFKAGASYYGVSDLELLDKHTHKFESQYNRKLIGPYPERQDLYHDRSPIHFTHQLSCPIILFQGLEDKVVPSEQAELMVTALRARKVPYAYIQFEGEQHGFRKKETIKRALEAELYFYSKIFHFKPADTIEPFTIENLPD
ncbi:MAG TPA: S9 family peptidase [Candidatus Bathyarchaeia archaeon]|nr:S9 family peptidase [Candidatus Bathyarchaeia archaeon]